MALAALSGTATRRRDHAGGMSAFERSRRRLYLPFVVPALLLHLVFVIGPTAAALWISFHRWDGVSPMEWTGLDNYTALLEDSTFRTALVNTLVILVVAGLAIFVISFVLTMIVRELRWKSFVRSVLFFPHIVSAIVLSIVWGFIFQHNGVVNTILDRLFGAEPIPWLNADNLFVMILIGTVWLSTGLYVTIIMAGVDRIPQYFYDDAQLAGASAFQRLRHVTLPLSWDVISVAAIFWTISSLKIFEFIYAFGGTTNDLPPPGVWNSALFVYGESFGGRSPSYLFGYASASAILMLGLFAFLVVGLRRLMRRDPIEF
ncbi:carbohydrate ABC transporter permease [Jiangella asiatica]|uniref:Sugar ABC transporter permease n=1 Tax=Jiangella asiatica TaxID=2530372 RepID=A0A4R5DEQ7_9ACTN|nr:sugar ABC transporter permease [Jiangella asiatica]TDE10351.1 sugar ABC transporter permease [Jiangella asiatica]